MAMKATATTRAPRGTKILTQAFFAAADGIPDMQRAAVIKSALAAIRDELKNARAKAKIAKAKTVKSKTVKSRAGAKAPKAAPAKARKTGSAGGKSATRKIARKPAPVAAAEA